MFRVDFNGLLQYIKKKDAKYKINIFYRNVIDKILFFYFLRIKVLENESIKY